MEESGYNSIHIQYAYTILCVNDVAATLDFTIRLLGLNENL